MRSLTLALVVVAACFTSGGGSCAASTAAPDAGRTAAFVTNMNAAGLNRLREMGTQEGSGDIVVSPFAMWYARRVLANTDEPHGAITLARAVAETIASRPGRTFENHLWLDDQYTSYSQQTAKALKENWNVEVSSAHWNPLTGAGSGVVDTPVDRPIMEWVSKRADMLPSLQDSSRPQTLVRIERPLGTDHPLNLLTSLRVSASFSPDLRSRWSSYVTLPTYRNDSISGVKLDSLDGSTSLYIFAGEVGAVKTFVSTIDVAKWGMIRTAFIAEKIDARSIAFESIGINDFSPDVVQAFGTQVQFGDPNRARQTCAIHVDSSGLRLEVIGGVAGVVANRGEELTVDHFFPSYRGFSLTRPLFYVVEDAHTGAMLMAGAHL